MIRSLRERTQKRRLRPTALKNLKKMVNCRGLQEKFKDENPPIVPIGIDDFYKPTSNPEVASP